MIMDFINLHENRTMKPIEIALSRGMKENDGCVEPNLRTLYAYMEMLQ
jgi:hypothetical protein